MALSEESKSECTTAQATPLALTCLPEGLYAAGMAPNGGQVYGSLSLGRETAGLQGLGAGVLQVIEEVLQPPVLGCPHDIPRRLA